MLLLITNVRIETLHLLLTPTVVAQYMHVQQSSASVILSVCPHNKTKTAETKITKLGTGIFYQDTLPTNEY